MELDVGAGNDCRDSPATEPRIETLSDEVGEKAEQAAGGEPSCEVFSRFFEGPVHLWADEGAAPDSVLGAMLETDLRDW